MCGFTIELGTSTNVDLEIYPLNFGRVSQWNWWNFQFFHLNSADMTVFQLTYQLFEVSFLGRVLSKILQHAINLQSISARSLLALPRNWSDDLTKQD